MTTEFMLGLGAVTACGMLFLLLAARLADWDLVPARCQPRIRMWVTAAPWVLGGATLLVAIAVAYRI